METEQETKTKTEKKEGHLAGEIPSCELQGCAHG